MDRRDRELLDKQMAGLTPPRNDGVIVGMLVAMFLVGVVLGNVLSAHQSEPIQISSVH
jgi:tetrahydromethanopterin S-methyltransferase subunit F